MIVVTVDLKSAISDDRSKMLAKMVIANDGTSAGDLRHYEAQTLRGRSASAFNAGQVQRRCRLENWPAEKLHVWHMVQAILSRMGYGPTRGLTQRSPADHFNYVCGPMVKEIVQGTTDAGGGVPDVLNLAAVVAAGSIVACQNFSPEPVDVNAFIALLKDKIASLQEPAEAAG